MAAGGGIEHQVPGRQLHRVAAERVFDHKFTAGIVGGIGQEQGGRQVRAYPDGGAGAQGWLHKADGIVDMRPEIHAQVVAVEQGWKDPKRQGCGHEAFILAQRAEDDVA